MEAKYIRTSTINHLRFNNEKAYVELCSFLLPNINDDHPKYEKDMTSHLAKQVRNRHFNPFQIKQTGYNQKQYPNQIILFK